MTFENHTAALEITWRQHKNQTPTMNHFLKIETYRLASFLFHTDMSRHFLFGQKQMVELCEFCALCML